jgi:hypothetical protein
MLAKQGNITKNDGICLIEMQKPAICNHYRPGMHPCTGYFQGIIDIECIRTIIDATCTLGDVPGKFLLIFGNLSYCQHRKFFQTLNSNKNFQVHCLSTVAELLKQKDQFVALENEKTILIR